MIKEMLPIKLSPRFVIDANGKRTQVILTIAEYKSILDAIERLKKSTEKFKAKYDAAQINR